MASVNDKITATRNAARPNSARVSSGRSAGATTLICDSLTGWPTESKVHFVTYQIDSQSNPVAGTQLDCSGIVSGNNIGSLTVIDGSDNGNSVGDVVQMLPTAAWGQDLYVALTEEHDNEGAHNATAAATIGNLLYPVGSIYTNASVATNPATLLGFGTWTAFGAGKVMVGLDSGDTDFDTAEETGGAKTHTLTTSEMPSHTHSVDNTYSFTQNDGGSNFDPAAIRVGANANRYAAEVQGSNPNTGSAGSGGAHNNLQPYIVVYMWKRIS